MINYIKRIARPEEGYLSLLLLYTIVLSSVATIVEASWVDQLDILYTTVIASVFVGFLVAKMSFAGRIVHPIVTLIGPMTTFYFVAQTLSTDTDGWGKVVVLWRRLISWLNVVQSGGFGNEPVLFLLLMTAAIWLYGYLSAINVYSEHSIAFPLVAGGSMIIINVSYAVELLHYIIPFALASVLLMARLNLYRQELTWKDAGMRYNSSIWHATLRVGALVAMVVAFFGWVAPEFPPQEGINPDPLGIQSSQQIRDIQNDFNRAFGGGIRSRGAGPPALSGFGNSMVLSGQFRLASYPVLRITTLEDHYWRAIIYDRYTGQGWVTGQPTTPKRLDPGATISVAQDESRIQILQTVEVLQPRGDFVFGASNVQTLDIPVSAEMITTQNARQSKDNGANPQQQPTLPQDPNSLRASLRPGTTYNVISNVSRATSPQLQSAGKEYPRDIFFRYTRLPQIPQRVHDLAVEITQSHDNNYDKARAIESYLRSFTYTLDVIPPPYDRDAVDYFLFDLQAGYCDYYSSSMAVMLRSIGIPARVVSGYATGTREGANEEYVIVRDNNAHSWVEVYFPKYGWIEFDPTASQPRLFHPVGYQPELAQFQSDPNIELVPGTENVDPSQDVFPDGGFPFLPRDTSPLGIARAILRPIAIGLGVILFGVVGVAGLWSLSLRGLTAPVAAYARVSQLARFFGLSVNPTETPIEYTDRLIKVAPQSAKSLRYIAETFIAHRFGRRENANGQSLVEAWRGFRDEVLRVAIERVMSLPRRIFRK